MTPAKRSEVVTSLSGVLRRGLRRPVQRDVHYLVSTAGHPNYGDEVIARAWLDYLAEHRPGDIVWLDCPHPGRAAHLFADTHPNLRVTGTLWELAFMEQGEDAESRIRGVVRDLGSPRVDPGLLALREVSGIHVLGGGYLNEIWPANYGVLAAVSEYARVFGVPARMTGAGLLPVEEGRRQWLREVLGDFQLVEVRDSASAAMAGVDAGLDDAFLALGRRRPIWSPGDSPARMVLVQGDLRSWTDDAAVALIERFLAPGGDAGWAEAIPPDDIHYARMVRPDGRFYSFGEIWVEGLPARAGQQWLTSRFHVHLLAAAAGAAGIVLAGRPGYYDIKHRSLLDLGTGWTMIHPEEIGQAELVPTVDQTFPERARALAARKTQVADAIYRP